MRTYLRPHLSPCGDRDDCVCLLNRHMAVDAVLLDLCAEGFGQSAAQPVVTGKAKIGVGRGGPLRGVLVVTGRAAHGGGVEVTAAAL